MFNEVLEALAALIFWSLLLLSNALSFWRAYRFAESGREKWLRPTMLAILWIEALLIVGCWERTGNLSLLPMIFSDIFLILRYLNGGMECLFCLILIPLLLGTFYFRKYIFKRRGNRRLLLLAVMFQTTLLLINVLVRGNYILQSVSMGVILLLVLYSGGSELLRLQKKRTFCQWSSAILSTLLALLFFVGTFPYLNPMDRQVEFSLLTCVEVPYTLSESPKWEGVYGKYCLGGTPLMYSPDGPATDVSWPEEMDLDHFSYIVCYGAEMESLTINIWETFDAPIRRSSYEGHVTFDEVYFPNSIFIYQIDRARIENTG